MKPTIVTFAGSARRDSLNKRLARGVAAQARLQGVHGVFVDLADYPLPLYDGDLEVSEGIPINALALARLLRDADGILIASPEYNGAYSALLKNTLDWLSRIDRDILSRPTAIASASPGSKGGMNGLHALRTTLEHMRVPVIDYQLSVPTADRLLDRDGGSDVNTDAAIGGIVTALIRQTEFDRSATSVA